MTAELQSQLDELKADCRRVIELGKIATTDWNADALEGMFRAALAQDARESMLAGITLALQGDEIRANAEFAATTRTFAPAVARMVLDAIEALEASIINANLILIITWGYDGDGGSVIRAEAIVEDCLEALQRIVARREGGEVSDTPRTDEAEFHPIADSYAYVVDSDFARTLERESAELRMDYEGQRDSEEASVRVANELLAERDALRVEVARLEGEVIARPICGKCGGEMTPDNSTVRPELFLHDECLPPELQRVAAVVSQTPRTDAEEADDWTPGARLVPADFARTLERELAEAYERGLLDGVGAVKTIRCIEHRDVEQQNRNEIAGAECGGCIAAERDALWAAMARLKGETK